MSDTNLIIETVAAIGQHISDKLDNKTTWCPEANRYSRAIIPEVMITILNSDVTKNDILLLFAIIQSMNASNKIGNKFLSTIGMPRMSLHRSEKKLKDIGLIFEFEDGSIMVNPNIVVNTKYRKMCLQIKKEWQTAIKHVKINIKE